MNFHSKWERTNARAIGQGAHIIALTGDTIQGDGGMTTDELTRSVRELQDRQSIYDCLLTYCRGVDRMDRELLLSSYHSDAVDDRGFMVASPAQLPIGR